MSLDKAAGYTLGPPICVAASTASQRVLLTSMGFVARGAGLVGVMPDYVTAHADGADLGVRFGDSAVAASLVAVSTVTAEAVTDAGATVVQKKAVNGTTERWMVPEGATHVAFISSAATGYARLTRASA